MVATTVRKSVGLVVEFSSIVNVKNNSILCFTYVCLILNIAATTNQNNQ